MYAAGIRICMDTYVLRVWHAHFRKVSNLGYFHVARIIVHFLIIFVMPSSLFFFFGLKRVPGKTWEITRFSVFCFNICYEYRQYNVLATTIKNKKKTIKCFYRQIPYTSCRKDLRRKLGVTRSFIIITKGEGGGGIGVTRQGRKTAARTIQNSFGAGEYEKLHQAFERNETAAFSLSKQF